MKECVKCGKHLGIIEGYCHPTMGKDTHLCSKCFDTVFESVENYRKFITPYIGFFNKESSTTEDIQKIGENIIKGITNMQDSLRNLRSHKNNHHNLHSS